MKNKIVLPNTSLCAIVRDEKMNPAGGIKRFVDSHVPYVENAVIVDTGSIDGTREILEELESKYSNLKIYDRKFKGFSDSRNYSLKKADAKYALVLDADELITSQIPSNEWEKIKEGLEKEFKVYSFHFEHILANGKKTHSPYWKNRLFAIKGIEFKFALFETHNKAGEERDLEMKIIHFLGSEKGKELKYVNQYNNFDPEVSPSQIEGFSEWKKYNPQRDFYE